MLPAFGELSFNNSVIKFGCLNSTRIIPPLLLKFSPGQELYWLLINE